MAGNPAAPCNAIGFLTITRNGSGAHTVNNNPLASSLPSSLRAIPSVLVDSLHGTTVNGAVVVSPMTPTATALFNGGAANWINGVNGQVQQELADLIVIHQNHPAARALIDTKLQYLSVMANTAGNRELCSNTLALIDRFNKQLKDAAVGTSVSLSADDMEHKTHPLCSMYRLIVKAYNVGVSLPQGVLTDGRFDKETGKILATFEKLRSVENAVTLGQTQEPSDFFSSLG